MVGGGKEKIKWLIKMGMAGLIFEPHPSNFENQYVQRLVF